MRVATAITGVTAAAAGFLPTAAAHAATRPAATTPAGKLAKTGEFRDGKLVRLKMDTGLASPDNTTPGQPYWLDILFKGSVHSYQVCGWHPTNAWRCTGWTTPSSTFVGDVGGNKYSWDRGKVSVRWNGGAAGHWDYCNTNGSYNGYAQSYGQSGHWSVVLTAPGGTGIGDGVARC